MFRQYVNVYRQILLYFSLFFVLCFQKLSKAEANNRSNFVDSGRLLLRLLI